VSAIGFKGKTMVMRTNKVDGVRRIRLVSAPWPLFNRPSLPLGALKAYLSTVSPDLQVDADHLYLLLARELGYTTYQCISKRVWRAEAIFSALLYPDQAHRAESLYLRTIKRKDPAPSDFRRLVERAEVASERWLEGIDWHALHLVGFSISFCQVTASLYLITRIKAHCPALPVVVGGSSFSGQQTTNLLSAFPQIDYLVVGEGERPLAGLIEWLDKGPCGKDLKLPDGVLSRHAKPAEKRTNYQLRHIEGLPVPDYGDYFKLLANFSPEDRFFPTIPIEASRGCWWRRCDATGKFRGCAFCNLNLQWRGYRTKTPRQVLGEINHQIERYQVLSLAFADNSFPIKHAGAIFDNIDKLGRDLSIFTELRATTPATLLAKMKKAGVDTVQVGIEALSSRLLEKMNKGVRAIDNLNMMKHCEALGIENASNLLLGFPGSDAIDVQETLKNLDFALWYRPLKPVVFWLGLKSPVYDHLKNFNIQSIYNHPNVRKIFPETVAPKIVFMIQGYRGDRRRQMKLWRPVERAIQQWEKTYTILQRRTGGKPAISYRDGGRFLIIDQVLPDQPTNRHRLVGVSAQIYRYCHIPRSIDQLSAEFRGYNTGQIDAFLRTMVAKRLIFREKKIFLSMAVPVHRPSR
jgi:ribosomal peptide maturation radical SAM protein 1